MPVPKSHVSLTKRLRKTSERIREKTESNHRGTMAQKRVALRNPDSVFRCLKKQAAEYGIGILQGAALQNPDSVFRCLKKQAAEYGIRIPQRDRFFNIC